MHDIMVGACVLIAVLLAITTTYWLPRVNHMSYLFKDNITLGLIAVVVVLLTLYDCKLGVAFAFVVAVVAVNMMQEGFEAFADMKSELSAQRIPITKEIAGLQVNKEFKGKQATKEFKPVNKGPVNKGIWINEVSSKLRSKGSSIAKKKEGFQSMAPEQGANIISEKIEKQMVLPKSCAVEQKDFNTYSAGKDYHGFDVAGCRYDLENRTQNSTVYGPPLSWCATYGTDSKLPVPFYPLNG